MERSPAHAEGKQTRVAAQETKDRLQEEMDALLSSGRCDRYKLQQLCRENGNCIPAPCRRRAWAVLLGVEGLLHVHDGLLDTALSTTAEDLSNQRVVTADVERTRQTIPEFRTERVKHSALKILTYYCKRKACIYRQGLNEILAPFLLIAVNDERRGENHPGSSRRGEEGGAAARESGAASEGEKHGSRSVGRQLNLADEGGTFNMFYAFMSRHLPHMFQDGFHSLQFLLRCLGLLLQYHDPELACFLQNHDVGQPVLYATSWVLTVFSHDLPMDTLLVLWDTYILEESPLLHLFVCLAWVMHFRHQLLSAPHDSVHDMVTSMRDTLRLSDEAQIQAVLRSGRSLQATTPASFRAYISRVGFGANGHPAPKQADVLWVEQLPALTIAASNAVQQLVQHVLLPTRISKEKSESSGQIQPSHSLQQAPAISNRETSSSTLGDVSEYTVADARRRAREQLVERLNTAVVVDTRPEAAWAKKHLGGCTYLHPRFLIRWQEAHDSLQQKREGCIDPKAANDLNTVGRIPYAQKILQNLFLELKDGPTRPVLVVGEGSFALRNGTSRVDAGVLPASEVGAAGGLSNGGGRTVPDRLRLHQAVAFLTMHGVKNVCVIEGGFQQLCDAVNRNPDLQKLCASAEAMESVPVPAEPPLCTEDLFDSKGALSATMVRVETAIDSAAEAASAAVGKAAYALEQRITKGASGVREGVSKAARSVTSSISSLTSWLNTEWRDGHVDNSEADNSEADNSEDEIAEEDSKSRHGEAGSKSHSRVASAGATGDEAQVLGKAGRVEEAVNERPAAHQTSSADIDDCEDSSFEAVLVDAVRVGRREPELGEEGSETGVRPDSCDDEETEDGLVLVGSARSLRIARPVGPLPERPAVAADGEKKKTQGSGWLAGLW